MLISAHSFFKVVTEQDRQTMDLLESYSEMDDNDVTQDIRSVFKHSMRNDHLLTSSLLEEALNS